MSSPSHLLACALQLSVMSLAILAASSTLKIVSMLLPSSPSALAYLVLEFPPVYVLSLLVYICLYCCFHFITLHVLILLMSITSILLILFKPSNIAAIANGYPTFVVSILAIGMCTAVIGDIAGHLGCFINLKDCVNAIAFVALGTSVPG